MDQLMKPAGGSATRTSETGKGAKWASGKESRLPRFKDEEIQTPKREREPDQGDGQTPTHYLIHNHKKARLS